MSIPFLEHLTIPAIATLFTFVLGIVMGPFAIKLLHRIKFGQEIRDEGPAWHKKKSGTPTMGGFIFILPVTVVLLIFFRQDFRVVMMLYLALAFGLIGFADDYIKVVKKRNMGLSALQKFSMQLVASIIFVTLLYYNGLLGTSVILPFAGISFDMGIWYLPFGVFVIVAFVNAVNLTDGLDGLATGVSIIVFVALVAIASKLGGESAFVFSLVCAGGLLAFLLFNRYPAKVFMGDTGSLFIGGAISAVAILGGLAMVLVIVGLCYVIEIGSVVLQVASFKLTGKRIFKMSPLHHHFEMLGRTENQIAGMFVLLAAVCGVIGYMSV